MKQYRIVIFIYLVGLAGCVSSPDVVSIGQETYMISRSEKGFRGSAATVKANALIDANNFCAKQGKVMKVVKTVQKDMKPFRSDAAAEVYFQCLSPNDPKLSKPIAIEEIRE
jgi:hypothetical protein